ncbi:MAG: prefoldin subunit alpha [Thermoplasmatota archaeon]
MEAENMQQNDIYLLQEYQEQMDTLYRQVQLLDEFIGECQQAQDALEEIAEGAKGEQMLVPLGGNVFMRATIADTEKVLTGVGSDVVVEKSVSTASDFLEKRIEELRQREEKLIEASQDIRARVQELQQRLQGQGSD